MRPCSAKEQRDDRGARDRKAEEEESREGSEHKSA